MKKYALRKKELRQLVEDLKQIGFAGDPKQIFIIEDEYHLIEVDGSILFYYYEGKVVPTLKCLNWNLARLPAVVVDMGAVKFVAGGADVMRPGIVDIPDLLKEDDLVQVIDEKNHKAIAVGRMLLNSEKMRLQISGKALATIHYVGDSIWNKSR